MPTFYTSFLFVLCAYYCMRIGYAARMRQKPFAFIWIFLSTLLLFLSADEWFGIHENLIIPLRTVFDIEQGPFYFAWTTVYIGLVITVLLVTIPWLRALERKFRNKLLFSAGVYITGALVFEMIGSWVYSTNGYQYTPIYANIVTIEESLELIGLTLATLTLATYFARYTKAMPRFKQ